VFEKDSPKNAVTLSRNSVFGIMIEIMQVDLSHRAPARPEISEVASHLNLTISCQSALKVRCAALDKFTIATHFRGSQTEYPVYHERSSGQRNFFLADSSA
jgi:hypothetical protein